MRDDVDLCWRAHAAGPPRPDRPRRRPAARRGRRPRAPHRRLRRPLRRQPAPRRQGRRRLHPARPTPAAPLLPYVLLRLVLGTLLRTLAYLVGKVPGQAVDEVARALRHPAAARADPRRTRSKRGRPAVEHERTAAALPAARRDRPGHRRTGRRQLRRAAPTPDAASAGRHGAVESGPGGDDADFLEIEQFARLKRIARKPGPVLFLVLLLVSLVACRGLLGGGALAGGALLPAPGRRLRPVVALRRQLASGRRRRQPDRAALPRRSSPRCRRSSSAPPASPLTLLLVCSVPLAGLTAYFASRPLVESRLLRAWASVAYAFLPAATGALAGGRLGTAVLAILLPLMARAAVAASGLRAARPGARPSWRATWAYALLLTFTMAFTPIVWPIALVLGIGACCVLRRQRDSWPPTGCASWPLLGTPLLVARALVAVAADPPSRFFQRGRARLRRRLRLRARPARRSAPAAPRPSAACCSSASCWPRSPRCCAASGSAAIRTAWAVALTGLLSSRRSPTAPAGPDPPRSSTASRCWRRRDRRRGRPHARRRPELRLAPAGRRADRARLRAGPLLAAASWMISGADGPLERRDPGAGPRVRRRGERHPRPGPHPRPRRHAAATSTTPSSAAPAPGSATPNWPRPPARTRGSTASSPTSSRAPAPTRPTSSAATRCATSWSGRGRRAKWAGCWTRRRG